LGPSRQGALRTTWLQGGRLKAAPNQSQNQSARDARPCFMDDQHRRDQGPENSPYSRALCQVHTTTLHQGCSAMTTTGPRQARQRSLLHLRLPKRSPLFLRKTDSNAKFGCILSGPQTQLRDKRNSVRYRPSRSPIPAPSSTSAIAHAAHRAGAPSHSRIAFESAPSATRSKALNIGAELTSRKR
jgi:hypothetical protein